jgi:hypothetical protein
VVVSWAQNPITSLAQMIGLLAAAVRMGPQIGVQPETIGNQQTLKGASTGFCVRAVPRSPDGQPLASRKDALFTVDAETHRERRRRSRVAGA